MALKIKDLGRRQLRYLRKDVIVNSYFKRDYSNRYGIDEDECYDFFEGYYDYLEELMREGDPNYTDSLFWDLIEKYDTWENLEEWHHIYSAE